MSPLVPAFLLFAHLLADFVLQGEGIAVAKGGDGWPAWRSLLAHGLTVGVLNLPIAVVFGWPGIASTVVIAAAHVGIDRAKVLLGRRTPRAKTSSDSFPVPRGDHAKGQTNEIDRQTAAANAVVAAIKATANMAEASSSTVAAIAAAAGVAAYANQNAPEETSQSRPADEGPPLDGTWSARPAALFILDQLAHIAVILLLWYAWLSHAAPTGLWTDFVNSQIALADRSVVAHGLFTIVVVTSLAIVNIRAAGFVIASLIRTPGEIEWATEHKAHPSPGRIGAAIGVMERLIVCAFVLAGSLDAVAIVFVAKTLARFKQLEDRVFSEYYVLGTLASFTIAVVSALVAKLVLSWNP